MPHHEPLRATLTRTVSIAIAAGAILAARWGGIARLPLTFAMMLWFSFGGHWVELWFLNWLRPRLPGRRGVQIVTRLAVWFVGGIVLGVGMALTAIVFHGLQRMPWASWWIAGLAFIGVELVVQSALQLRGRPSFFNGRG